jgi:uncharacterized protein
MFTLLSELRANINRVTITALEGNTFVASIALIDNGEIREVDSRPSDAIAMALRMQSPIFVNRSVMEQAQMFTLSPDDETMLDENAFSQVEREKWKELLEEMDPKDFKYKM